MAPITEDELNGVELRYFRWLGVIYSLFIVYGSFIPFEYSADRDLIPSQLVKFFAPPYAGGIRTFSIPDVVSNVLLFVPFGFFLIAGALLKNVSRRTWRASLLAGLAGFSFGLAIEIGQAAFPGRSPSFLDALCNGSGATIGGALGSFLLQSLRGKLAAELALLAHERPSLLVLSLLLLIALINAFYPFHITLDVSTVWENFKRAQWIPFRGRTPGFWADAFIEKTLLFAAVTFLIFKNLRYNVPAKKLALLAGAAFALALEVGKLLFAGRAPNMASFLFSTIGSVAGVTMVPWLANTRFVQRHAIKFLLLVLIVVAVYFELTPFDWVYSIEEFQQRISKIEWLPFVAYYHSDPQAAVFDLAKKLVLLASVGFLVAKVAANEAPDRIWGTSLIVGFILGITLEVAQIALRSRTPSVTDVLLFALGSACGGHIFERYERFRLQVSDLVESFSTESGTKDLQEEPIDRRRLMSKELDDFPRQKEETMKKLLMAVVLLLAIAGTSLAAVNINTANKEELTTLKGIGEKRAQDIIDYRTKHGPFKSVDDLEKVPGIGPGIMKQIRPDITVTGKTVTDKPAETKSKAADTKTSKQSETKKAETAKGTAAKVETQPSEKSEGKKTDEKSAKSASKKAETADEKKLEKK